MFPDPPAARSRPRPRIVRTWRQALASTWHDRGRRFHRAAYRADPVGRALHPLARRRQQALAVRLVPRLAAVLIVGWIVLAIPMVLLGWTALVPIVPVVSGAAAVGLIALVVLWSPAPLATALATDARLGLHERLSSAVALRADADVEMHELQRSDALAVARTLRAAEAFPFRVRRREVLALIPAVALLVLWLAAAQRTPLAGMLAEPGPTFVDGTAVAPGLDLPGAGDQPLALPAAAVEEQQQLQAALAQLLQQIDPDAQQAAAALSAAAGSLRRSAEGRALGRALAGGDFNAAAAETRRLAGALSELNTGQLDELAQALRSAAGQAAQDPGVAERLGAVADALASSALADARLALEELARATEAIEQSTGTNAELQRQIDALAAQLAASREAARSAPAGSGEPTAGEAIGPGAAPGGRSAGAASGETAGTAAGGAAAAAQGRELPGELETLPPEQRLNASGQLELVPIAPTAEGSEPAERPILELGTDRNATLNASAGTRGFAAGRPDVDRTVAPDLQSMLESYFGSP